MDKSIFDRITDRRNTGSLKWNVREKELPMWVADMDFTTAPEIIRAISDRASHGIFGYTEVEDEWYEAYIDWWKNRHNFSIKKEWLMFCTGVVPAISSIVRKITTPAENVLVMTPSYNIFYNSILNNGRNVLECSLIYKDGGYEVDYEDFEKKLSNPQTTLFILCNPHNPTGKIWSEAELIRMGSLCAKHGVKVISDEIHCDITAPGKNYTPFASVSELCRDISITCIAPTKTFNIAGIQTAAIMVPDRFLYNRVNRSINTDEVAEPNVFAAIAPIYAYRYGSEWLDGLREYLWENRRYACNYIRENMPQIKTVDADATYLLWMDCNALDDPDICGHIRERTGLYLCDGREYRNGDGFLRMNLACSKETLKEGLLRLNKYINEYL